MGDYTEHLITMASGDGDMLDQIQRRRKNHEPCTAEVCGSRVCQTARDRDYLLALVREQAAQIGRVRGAQPIDGVTGEAAKYAAGFNAAIEAVNELLTATDKP